MQNNLLMSGKRGIVMGVINKWSIAWGIAKALDEAGAEIAFTCVDNNIKEKVSALTSELSGSHRLYECNVKHEESIEKCFNLIKEDYGNIDFLVHSIAFADKEFLKGRYSNVTKEAFLEALDISCYSFTSCASKAYKMMNNGGSMMALSYYGAEKYVTNYNIMGVAKAALESSIRYLAYDFGENNIRVNGISAGMVKTISAKGIADTNEMGEWCKATAAIKRNVDIDDVGKSSLYLLSDMASGVTGQILYVDCGHSVCGVPNKESLARFNERIK